MLVPLISMNEFKPPPAITRSGNCVASMEFRAAVATIRLPGATSSGFNNPSIAVRPREL